MSAWTDHVARWSNCTDCPLCEQRDRIVLARGAVPCDVVFVGEAPGLSEDTVGQPFVGPAGKLLDQVIDRALPADMKFALTNLVACFPAIAKGAGTNEPDYSEVEACRGRLVEFIHLARPRLVVCVGNLASDNIPTVDEVGFEVRYADITHPAAILRMPLAQKQMAVQKCVVILRNAVQDMLECNQLTTGGRDASIEARGRAGRPRRTVLYTTDDRDLPF